MPNKPETELDRLVPLVWAALLDHVGEDKAVSGAGLAAAAFIVDRRGEPDTRTLRLVIHHAITVRNKLICSSPGLGYFRPATQDEIDHQYRRLRAHGLSELVLASRFLKYASREVRDADDWIDQTIADSGADRQEELFVAV